MASVRDIRRIRKTSQKQEKKTAQSVGGRTQAASGALRLGGGGDVRAPGFRIECKFTEKNTYTLKLDELRKLKKQAQTCLEIPVLQFSFPLSGKFSLVNTYAVIPYSYSMREKISRTPLLSYQTNAKQITLNIVDIASYTRRGSHIVCFEREKKEYFEVMPWERFVEEYILNKKKENA